MRLLAVLFLATLPLVTPRLRASDEIEYFAYLRSAVFDHDLEFGNEYQHFYDQNPGGLRGFQQTFLVQRDPVTQRHINFGPVGSALLWAPFYLVAHAAAVLAHALGFGSPPDGYGAPYVASVCYASAAYGFAGMLLIYSALRRFGGFADPAASWSVAALWFGTPALYYMTLAPGFAHANSLFAVSLMLWLWLRLRAGGRGAARDWALVGAAGGLAALVREQDALFLAVPALHLAWESVRRRDLRGGAARMAALGGAALLVFVPQLLVYRTL